MPLYAISSQPKMTEVPAGKTVTVLQHAAGVNPRYVMHWEVASIGGAGAVSADIITTAEAAKVQPIAPTDIAELDEYARIGPEHLPQRFADGTGYGNKPDETPKVYKHIDAPMAGPVGRVLRRDYVPSDVGGARRTILAPYAERNSVIRIRVTNHSAEPVQVFAAMQLQF